MIKVRLGPPRSNFTGKLGGVNWKDGCATLPTISNRMNRSYGVVEDKSPDIDKPTLLEAAKASQKEIVDDVTKGILEATEIERLKGDSIEIIIEPEDTINEISPVDPEDVFEEANQKAADEGAKALSDIVAAKKQEIEQAASKDTNETSLDVPKNPLTGATLKKSDIKSIDDFKGKGSWGKYVKYVKDLTGVKGKCDKANCAEALATFKNSLED